MNCITIIAPTYEEAVKEARSQYGDRIRIHSRKDVVSGGFLGFGKKKHCELTCFLADEETPETPKSGGTLVSGKTQAAQDADDEDLRRFEREAHTPNPEDNVPDPAMEPSGHYETMFTPQTDYAVKPEMLSSEGDGTEVPSNSEEGAESATDSESKKEEGMTARMDETEKPEKASDTLEPLMAHARSILTLNDFSEDYIKWITSDLRSQLEPALPVLPTKNEFELLIIDRIVGSVDIDHNSQLHPPRIFAVVGPTGVGKTTTIAKIAAVYGTIPPDELRKKVRIITMDSFRVGAYEQIESFGRALNIPVLRADDESQFFEALEKSNDAELILIDTIGRSPRDSQLNVKLQTMLSVPDKKNTRCYLAVSASMKKVDIDKVFEQFKMFNIVSVIVTKADETQTIGNILSICHDRHIPLLFITDGQMVPRDIHKASSAFVLGLLRGFNMDLNSLWNTQIGSDE